MVSLLAKTWKNLGLRPDLAQMMANMHPGLLRFPGGSFSEGHILADRWGGWNPSGMLRSSQAPGISGALRSSNGLGFLNVAGAMPGAVRSAGA